MTNVDVLLAHKFAPQDFMNARRRLSFPASVWFNVLWTVCRIMKIYRAGLNLI
jgi:hypothetical protein